MNVRYDARADRVLWQVTGRGNELFQVWLTRRLTRQLWGPLRETTTRSDIATQVSTPAAVLPQARPMLAAAAGQRALPGADFGKPFKPPEQPTRPLGDEPLLPATVELGVGAGGRGLRLSMREDAGRSLNLNLGADLTTALMRLLVQALREADWGLDLDPEAAHGAAPDARAEPRLLN